MSSIKVRAESKNGQILTWQALSKAFNLAYCDLTETEKKRVRRVVTFAGVACGQIKPGQDALKEVLL